MYYIGINGYGGGCMTANSGGGVFFFDNADSAHRFWDDARVSRKVHGPFDRKGAIRWIRQNTDLSLPAAAAAFDAAATWF